MIDLNQPPVRAAGLLMFADDRRPPVWHVVPERPVLEILEGRPAFLLIKYRVNLDRGDWPRGGGLLRLQCGLRLKHSALAEARSVLMAQSAGDMPNIVPLKADRVTCELVLSVGDAGQSVVAATPLSDPPFGASFHVPLSIEGVTLFEQGLQSGVSPAFLRYEMVVKARAPQLPAQVAIDWRRISERRMAEGTPPDIQRLIEEGNIRIEIRQRDGDTDGIERMMERVVEEVSHLVATRFPADVEGRTTALFDLTQAREEERLIVATATITQLLEPLGPNVRPESLIALMEEGSHG
jgi:hypothetical protein